MSIHLKEYNLKVHSNARLADYTTFKIGGPCPHLIECDSIFYLILLIQYLRQKKIKYILIGAGSNLLVSDQGLDRVVIRFYAKKAPMGCYQNRLTVCAGTPLDDLSQYAQERGLKGLNFTAGIPGTVGGAIVGNAGAFGQQISDVLESVMLLSPGGRICQVKTTDLKFGYRDSLFKTKTLIILSAVFKLKKGQRNQLRDERTEILTLRRQKHPDWRRHPCAGSFFKNVQKKKSGQRISAGVYLDQIGAKQMHSGQAAVFAKHANIIINKGQAKAQDILNLSERMAQAVDKEFRIKLKREIRLVGRFKGRPYKAKGVFW